MTFKLRPSAKKQLFEIYDYTADHFGEAQAEKYLRELASVFGLLGSNPHIGQPYVLGTRQFIHGRHIIVYEPDTDFVVISQILHAAQRQ